MPRFPALVAIAATGLLPLLGVPPSAFAATGELTVYQCKLPDGTPAPAADGWSGGTNNCSGALHRRRVVLGAVSEGTSASATLTAPSGLTITKASLWRAFNAPAGGNYSQPAVGSSWESRGYQGAGGYSGDAAANLYDPADPAHALVLTGDRSGVSFVAACTHFAGNPSGTCNDNTFYDFDKLDLVLRDSSVPAVSSPPSGTLLDGAWHTGSVGDLDLGASDGGSGVYRVFLREGTRTVYAAADAGNATCKDAVSGNASAYEFTSIAPCVTAASAYHPVFDLVALGDGTHTVSIGVEDAAGNERIPAGFEAKTVKVNAPGGTLPDPGTACTGGAYDASGTCVATGGGTGGGGTGGGSTGGGGGGGAVTPVGGGSSGGGGGGSSTTTTTTPATTAPSVTAPVTASAAGLPERRPNGANAAPGGSLTSRFAVTEKRQLRVGYGKKVTVRGQLVNAKGVPVSHGQVEVITYARVPGAQPVRLKPVTTDAQGDYAVTIPAGASRLVRLAYRAYLDDLDFSQVSDLDLRVVTKVHLGASPKAVRNGRTVRFAGSIAGAPSGSRKVVEMQVLQGTHWVTFGTTRIKRGRFSYRYHFTRTFRTTKYAFRAIVRTDAGWPYETGTSLAKRVTVRP